MPANWDTGGLADSKRRGIPNSSYTLKNCDIHTDPGVLKCAQSLVDDGTGALPTQAVVEIIPVVEGGQLFSYFFGSGGSVWKRTSAGVYSKVGDITSGIAYGSIDDAKLFNGDMYYTMQERVGKYTPGAAWGNRDDNFAEINFDLYHPLKVVQNDLWVGHTNNVGKIAPTQSTGGLSAAAAADQGGSPNVVRIPATAHGLVENDSVVISGSTNYNNAFLVVNVSDSDHFDIESPYTAETFGGTEVFSVNMTKGLLLESEYTVESFGAIGRNLIVGTRQVGIAEGDFLGFSKVYRWDLISDTYSAEQQIKEFGISAFMEYNGSLLFNAGQDGNLYSYDGQFARKFRRIPNSITNDTSIAKNATSDIEGITILGVSQSGDSGGYTLGGYDPKFQDVFNLPYHIAGAQISAIEWVGGDLLFAYKIGSSEFMKKLSTTLETAETESLVQNLISKGQKVVVTPRVEYESFPNFTNIQLFTKVDNGSYTEMPLTQQTDNVLTGNKLLNAREVQYKLILTPNGTTTPVVEFFG